MIKLKSLLFENYCLVLTEDNSGYTDYKLHKYISNKLFNCWMDLLNEVNDKGNTIENTLSQSQNYFKKQIDDGNFFTIDEHDVDMNIQMEQKINVLLAFENKRKDVVINGAAINLYSDPIEIYLQINPIYSVNDILYYKDYIEELSHHESVHLIKFIQKLHQISVKGNERNDKEQSWYNKYLSQTQEIHAYTSQLNNELKHIKLKYPNITFSQAINQSKIFQRYKRNIFVNNPKLRSKMLSKVANYWNNI